MPGSGSISIIEIATAFLVLFEKAKISLQVIPYHGLDAPRIWEIVGDHDPRPQPQRRF